ncbi:hypothetical protein LZG04_09170 [Saccharothrix sp. S26]|uniref:hypothetical protein n=1 Tax=Saccharothrix sp. S26 TaxID=2907215 RepID=UPI001F35AFE3|nr:hypothetical protein [Saccharothrix sp. S26]MCE6994976.1 hypothetical protein [Saccharothrix sp. S26]
MRSSSQAMSWPTSRRSRSGSVTAGTCGSSCRHVDRTTGSPPPPWGTAAHSGRTAVVGRPNNGPAVPSARARSSVAGTVRSRTLSRSGCTIA